MKNPVEIGNKYGMLTVKEFAYKSKTYESFWICECDCGNITKPIKSANLKNGHTQSCGCYCKKMMSLSSKKYNDYNIDYDFCIGFTRKGLEFYFDLEDYDKIKNICWYLDKRGYVVGYNPETKKQIKFHRYILNVEPGIEVDHINRKTNDNRKSNLRLCSHNDNLKNSTIREDNTSGIIGISFKIDRNKWMASISSKMIGRFDNLEDAIVARLKAEKELYGDFAPQKHLFEEYGI